MGPKINSEFDDDGPFIDYEGTTLYFSTKGRKGMGGFDIFKSIFDAATNEWSEPVPASTWRGLCSGSGYRFEWLAGLGTTGVCPLMRWSELLWLPGVLVCV
jgi:hypothetical protein